MITSFLLRSRPADLLNLLFLLLLTAIVSLYHTRVGNPSVLIGLYSGMILLQVVVIRIKDRGRFLKLFHALIFPTASILIIFDSFEKIVHYLNPRDIDPLLIRLDYILLGCYPTIELEKITTPLITEILQLSYSTYYLIPFALGITLYRKGKEAEFERALFFIMLCFYLSYVGYLLFPALGPRYTMAHLQTGDLQGWAVTGHIQAVLNALEGVKRDAFPSGHTGISLTVLYLAHRFERRMFFILLPVVTALVFSTIYCRYHYVVDVIGGIVLTLITIVMGEVFYGYRSKRIDSGR
ncbi:MAG: phosphatase PAP2 family protein [Thermodesulfovibrionales bacterium]